MVTLEDSEPESKSPSKTVFSRIRDLVGKNLIGKKKSIPPEASEKSDPAELRKRVTKLLGGLQANTKDAATRLVGLRTVVEDMEEIFSAMLGESNRSPEVLELAEVIAKIRALLAETQPAEAAIDELWSRTDTALRNILVAIGGTPPTAREGFWK